MNTPLITVIIPVYQVENYIKRCIESVISQTYSNLEILLVDDGTLDKSAEICQEYADKDSRITVLHKKNGGLSDARNYALNIMNGEYVTFIDSDDYVTVYYIEHLYKALLCSNADMSISWFKNVFESCLPDKNDCKKELQNLEILSSTQCLERMFYQNFIEISAWGKLYKSCLFDNLRYPFGKLYEDIPVTPVTVQRSNKIAVIKNVDYFYFQRKNGIQNMYFNPSKMNAIENMSVLRKFIEKQSPENIDALSCRYFSTVSNILFQIKDDDHNTEKKYYGMNLKHTESLYYLTAKHEKKHALQLF